MAELKGEPIHAPRDPEVSSRIPAFIPESYVEDAGQRLQLYKRLSGAAGDEQRVLDIVDEMADRFGPAPPEVAALAELMVLKGLAMALEARALDLGERRFTLVLDDRTPLDPAAVARLAARPRSRLKLAPGGRLVVTFTEGEAKTPLVAARNHLRSLLAHANAAR